MSKEIRRMTIEPAENGGHTVEHHYKESPSKRGKALVESSVYHDPESHVFGKDEGHEMLAHIANHLGIEEMEGDEEHTGEGKEGKMGSKMASKIREKVGKY